jgi:transaldolase
MDQDRIYRLYHEFGQSPWLDNLQRGYLTSGHLDRLISRGIRGLTSNPTIFQKAIQGSADYDAQFGDLAHRHRPVLEDYWELVLDDIEGALEHFRQLYDDSEGSDGFVSVEVAPELAHDTVGTEKAARDLHERINKPNLMVKIPGTEAGLPAIRQMIAEGRSINITLLFSLDRYQAVIDAYLDGLEQYSATPGAELSNVAGVASFFISRVDSEVDRRLDEIGSPEALSLRGTAAVAQGKLAYQQFLRSFSGARWNHLLARGARVQRPLWASTSTKNPAYKDTLYVDELIGPDTVNTLPDATVEAFADHGTLARRVDADVDQARAVWQSLADVGVDMTDVSATLEAEGVTSFEKSFDDLIRVLHHRAVELRG